MLRSNPLNEVLPENLDASCLLDILLSQDKRIEIIFKGDVALVVHKVINPTALSSVSIGKIAKIKSLFRQFVSMQFCFAGGI